MLALVAVAGLLAYLLATARLHAAGRRWPARRTAAAVAGAALVAAAGLLPGLWPASAQQLHEAGMHGAGHHGAVPHMAQHVLLGMVAPVAVVAAAPATLLLALSPVRSRPLLARLVRSRAAHVLGHPVVAAVPVVVGVHVLLLTPLLATSLASAPVHGLVLAHTLLSGTWLTWALVGGDPAPARSPLALRLVVLALVAGTHAHLATLLYARAGRLPPGTGWSVGEVERAAMLMYYAGDAAELLLAVAVVVVWYRAGTARGRRRGTTAPARGPGPRPGRPVPASVHGPTLAPGT